MAIAMRIENVFCEECGVTHYVQVVRRNPKGLILETKCLGKDFLPIESKLPISAEPVYIRHRLGGYDIVRKAKTEPKKRLPTTFKRQAAIPAPVMPAPSRVCVAEISMMVKGEYVTIKVFDDATADKFYEFFYQVGDRPVVIRPRNMGKESPVHISEIPNVFRINGKVKTVFHNRQKYEKLLTADPASISAILEKNQLISSTQSTNK